MNVCATLFFYFKTYKTNWIQMKHKLLYTSVFSWNSNQHISCCQWVILFWNVEIHSAVMNEFFISDLWCSVSTISTIDISPRYVHFCITFCQNIERKQHSNIFVNKNSKVRRSCFVWKNPLSKKDRKIS